MRRHTTLCEPFDHITINELKGLLKEDVKTQPPEQLMARFDLGYVPRKYHIIFLFFLRLNQQITTLHCSGINIKSDLIQNLLRDFVHLKEFTLSFSQ